MTLPNSLHNDIITLKRDKKFKNRCNAINQLKSFNDLENLRLLARERQSWITLVKDSYVAAKAERNLKFFNVKYLLYVYIYTGRYIDFIFVCILVVVLF